MERYNVTIKTTVEIVKFPNVWAPSAEDAVWLCCGNAEFEYDIIAIEVIAQDKEEEEKNMMTTEEMVMYDTLVDMGIATPEEINLAYNMCGGLWSDVLNKILFIRTGYRSIEQMMEDDE